MSEHNAASEWGADAAPGDQEAGAHAIAAGVRNYLIGLVLAAGLIVGSFWVASGTSLIYVPGVPMALAALAVGQMDVHLALFFHLTTGPTMRWHWLSVF